MACDRLSVPTLADLVDGLRGRVRVAVHLGVMEAKPMRVETKKVFYCDHCGQRRLMRSAMEKHELHCTMNPDRVCRWHLLNDMPSTRMVSLGHPQTHRMRRGLPRWVNMFAPLDEAKLERLREHAQECPACMLAAVRQCGIERLMVFDYSAPWDYSKEVERYRKEEQDSWDEEERWATESTFL